jgi:hypothetical protein
MLKVRPHVILFETTENPSLSSTHYAQSRFYVFTETTLLSNCVKFRAVLEKKRFWEGSPWDVDDKIVWDPKKSTTEKVFKDTAIYWDAYLEYLVGLKNPGAMIIAKWGRQEQWNALGIWGMFVNGETCRIPTDDEKRLAIEMGTFLGVSGEFFRMLEGCNVGDQRSEYLRAGEEDDRSEIDLGWKCLRRSGPSGKQWVAEDGKTRVDPEGTFPIREPFTAVIYTQSVGLSTQSSIKIFGPVNRGIMNLQCLQSSFSFLAKILETDQIVEQ